MDSRCSAEEEIAPQLAERRDGYTSNDAKNDVFAHSAFSLRPDADAIPVVAQRIVNDVKRPESVPNGTDKVVMTFLRRKVAKQLF